MGSTLPYKSLMDLVLNITTINSFFSVVLMAVVDSNYEFIMVDIGANVITDTKFDQLLEKEVLNIKNIA